MTPPGRRIEGPAPGGGAFDVVRFGVDNGGGVCQSDGMTNTNPTPTKPRQFCCRCHKTTSDYTTTTSVDAYGGRHRWHTCQACGPVPPMAPTTEG